MRLVLLILCALAQAVANTEPPLTNETVAKMAAAGVPEATIIKTIEASNAVSFQFQPAQTDWLMKQGVSEGTIKAMAARSSRIGGGTPCCGCSASASRGPQAPRAAREWPTDNGMSPGDVEVSGGFGFNVMEGSRDLRPSAMAAGAVAINRYLAVYGETARNSLGSSGFESARYIELGGGLQVNMPNRSAVEPYIIGGVSLIHQRYSLSNLVNVGTDTLGAGHAGGGFKFHVRPWFGIRTDVRAFRGFDGGWFGRTTFGVFYQFR